MNPSWREHTRANIRKRKIPKTDKKATGQGHLYLNPFLRLRRKVVVISRVLPRLRRFRPYWGLEVFVVLVHHAVDELPKLSADLAVRSDICLLLSDVYTHIVYVLSHLGDVVADLDQHV